MFPGPEIKFLDEIQTKVSFLPCYWQEFSSLLFTFTPLLYICALRFIFHLHNLLHFLELQRRKTWKKTIPFPWGLRNPYRNLKSENSQDYAQKETSTKLYVHEFVFCSQFCLFYYLGQLGCVSSSDGTPCDTPLSQASRVKRRNKKKRPITIGSTTIIPLKGAQTWTFLKFRFTVFFESPRHRIFVRNSSSSAEVADPHNLNADPDPAFHWNVENADPDSAPHDIKVMRICDHLSTDPLGSIVSLHASIVNVHGPPRLHWDS